MNPSATDKIDRPTPAHDELMMWLDTRSTLLTLLLRGFPEKKQDIITVLFDTGAIQRIWEHPITVGEGKYARCVGALDLYIPRKHFQYFEGKWRTLDPVTWSMYAYRSSTEKPIFAAIASYAFEVKPKITSLGQVIRQMKICHSYQPCNRWYIVSNTIDEEHKAVLKSQEFRWLERYPKTNAPTQTMNGSTEGGLSQAPTIPSP